jgi:DNA-binding transcriptional MerR regulator
MSPLTPQRRFLGTRAVGQRYGGKSPRTIKRWWEKGVIPPPDQTIKNRHYWDEAALDHHDRQRVAERAAASSKAATA